jgi:PKD repeat protein
VADSGTYWVTVTTANLCVGLDTIIVSFSEDTITAEFLSASTINVGDTLHFISITTPESVVYSWDFDDGVTSTSEDPQHIFLTAKTHQVTLEVSNEYCTETVMKEILVLPLKEEPDGPFVGAQYNEIVRAEVYPVPTDGEFTVEVELEQEATVYLFLYDNKGYKIDVRTVEADFLEETYNISNLASALYLLKVVVGENTEVIKIVKY